MHSFAPASCTTTRASEPSWPHSFPRVKNLPRPGKASENPAWSRSPSCSQAFPDFSSCTRSHIQVLSGVSQNPRSGLDAGSPPRDRELQPIWPRPFVILHCACPSPTPDAPPLPRLTSAHGAGPMVGAAPELPWLQVSHTPHPITPSASKCSHPPPPHTEPCSRGPVCRLPQARPVPSGISVI